jgi:putative redox protein
MSIQAQLKWTNGLQLIARPEDGPAVVLDNKEGRSGPTPMELVLMGVAGCTAMDVVSIMEKKRSELSAFAVNVTGEQAKDHPRRFTRIVIEYVLHGKGIKAKAVEQAIALSHSKYCSALASVNAEVAHSYRIVEE